MSADMMSPQPSSWRSSATRPGRPGNPEWIKNSKISRDFSTQRVIVLRRPHTRQLEFIDSAVKRTVVRAGRRGGKTVGAGTLAVKKFLQGHRVLYGAPTSEQIDAFWFEVKRSLREPIDAGDFYKNETEHVIEVPDTKQRIRAKTVWNADTLRGDYADVLILDEFHLINEDAWELVGAPMMLDNNGDAFFFYTPPSLRSRSVSKARDPRHASKLFKKAAADESGRWKAVHFTSYDNPYISQEALQDITEDMTRFAIQQEIMADDLDDAPGAMWDRDLIDEHRVDKAPDLIRVCVAIDPPANAKASGSGAGIMVGGIDRKGRAYLLEDRSKDNATPAEWGRIAVATYDRYEADRIVAEVNNGGDMVREVVYSVDDSVGYKAVRASRGKAIRAEPIAAKTEQNRVWFAGEFPQLEDELCLWQPGDESPHRLDAFVWLMTDLFRVHDRPKVKVSSSRRPAK